MTAVPLAIACGASTLAPVGYSTGRGADTSGASDAGSEGAPPRLGDVVAGMTQLSGRQRSHGHGEAFDAIVWGNDAARSGWASGGAMPEGAILVEEAIATDVRGDLPAGTLTMKKSDGAWTFAATSPDGGTTTDLRCHACHEQATTDEVFRVYQSTSTQSTAPITAAAPTSVATTAATIDARSAGRADASVSP